MENALLEPLAVALSAGAGFCASWLLRRDAIAKSTALETAQVNEIERRVTILENTTVTKEMFSTFSDRLAEIRSDLRAIRDQIQCR
jgi:hypothetical protein